MFSDKNFFVALSIMHASRFSYVGPENRQFTAVHAVETFQNLRSEVLDHCSSDLVFLNSQFPINIC